jgi:hypothetical protein
MNSEIAAKVKLMIKPTDRIIMAKRSLNKLNFPVRQRPGQYALSPKPAGLWYAVGSEWIDWCQSEMPEWVGDKYYRIEVTDKVLKVDTLEKLRKFEENFGEVEAPYKFDTTIDHPMVINSQRRETMINWERVARQYAGIEIAPYRREFIQQYSWYSPWDVASGCIWDKSGIKSLKRIQLRRPKV